MTPIRSLPQHQSGSALVTTIMLMAILLLLGVAAMVGSDSQYRIAGNLQFENEALTRVENVMTTAESTLVNSPTPIKGDPRFATYSAATPHLFPMRTGAASDVVPPDPLSGTWSGSNSLATAPNERYRAEMLAANISSSGESAAMSTVQATGGCKQANIYRVSARVEGARGASKTVQSVYSLPSCK